MIWRRVTPFLLASVLLAVSACAPAADPGGVAAPVPVPAERLALEARVLPVDGDVEDQALGASLAERMAFYGIPGVTIAVYRDGALDWAAGYGDGVDEHTLFQAASLSKMVAGAGIAALAKEKGASLDGDISPDLQGIDPATLNPEGLPITLRALLSHTNGTNVSGFPGYAEGEPVPSTLQVITGGEPANTPAIVLSRPDTEEPFAYSGGGYTLAQYWAEQVSGEDFAALMQRLVLGPVGMEASTFVQPLPDGFVSRAAPAHEGEEGPIEGGWNTYPEQAAAGLWTTPTDFGRFMLALGTAGRGIDADVAAEVVRPVVEDYGLGVGILMWGAERAWMHSGGNRGYECYALYFPDRGDVIVVMTNAQGGRDLYREIIYTASRLYGWPTE